MADPTPSPGTSLVTRAARAVKRVVGSLANVTRKSDAASEPALRFPVTPFASWGYDEASDAVDEAIENSELDAERAMRNAAITPIPDQAVFQDPRDRVDALIVNRAFFQGDHWQMGAGWIGPHPQV